MSSRGSEGSRQPVAERWALCLLCALAYLYVFPYQAQLNNPNENVRIYMTAALVEYGHYEIDELRTRWGWVNDAAVHGGHAYSVKAPGTSVLGVPGYFVYRELCRATGHAFDRIEALWVCRVTASILPTLLFAIPFLGWLSRRTRHAFARDTVFVSVLLGSLLYAYATMFVSHTTSAIVAFLAFMWLYDMRHGDAAVSSSRAFWAGLFTAGITWFEYPGLACSLPLAVYGVFVLRKPKLLASFALGGLLPALAMMHFQWRAFGSPFTPGHLYVENPAFRAAHQQGLYGAVGPSRAALYGLLFDPGAGLFPLTPLLALSLPGLWLLLRDRRTRADALCVLSVVLLTLLAIASMNNWRGGWTIGPRYLALCVPFLGWPALVALDAWAERAPRTAAAAAIGCTAVGLCASGLPAAYYPHLPPEITRPLPQVFALLLRHDFAPMNAGAFFGVFGTVSMLPLLLGALAALSVCVRSLAARSRALVLVGALAIAAVLSVPIWVRPSTEPGVREAVAFITRRFWPVGHDQAARLREQMMAASQPDPSVLARLAALYREEGREDEARALERGAH